MSGKSRTLPHHSPNRKLRCRRISPKNRNRKVHFKLPETFVFHSDGLEEVTNSSDDSYTKLTRTLAWKSPIDTHEGNVVQEWIKRRLELRNLANHGSGSSPLTRRSNTDKYEQFDQLRDETMREISRSPTKEPDNTFYKMETFGGIGRTPLNGISVERGRSQTMKPRVLFPRDPGGQTYSDKEYVVGSCNGSAAVKSHASAFSHPSTGDTQKETSHLQNGHGTYQSLATTSSTRSVTGSTKGLNGVSSNGVSKKMAHRGREHSEIEIAFITERILVLTYPSNGAESSYRSSLKEISKMLKTKHGPKYKIFNVSKRREDLRRLNEEVSEFGWPEELAPPLEKLCGICKEMDTWLNADPLNTAVVHSKGGKSRPAVVIAAYMHYSNICASDDQALDRLAMRRFTDDYVGGIAQPSHRRYVMYFSGLLSGAIKINSSAIYLQHAALLGLPQLDGNPIQPFVKIYEKMVPVYNSGVFAVESDQLSIRFTPPVALRGDVLVKCFHRPAHNFQPATAPLLFRSQFNTCALEFRDGIAANRLTFSKDELDEACYDMKFPDFCRMELLFSRGPVLSEDHIRMMPTPEIEEISMPRWDSYDDFENGSEDEDLRSDDDIDINGNALESYLDLGDSSISSGRGFQQGGQGEPLQLQSREAPLQFQPPVRGEFPADSAYPEHGSTGALYSSVQKSVKAHPPGAPFPYASSPASSRTQPHHSPLHPNESIDSGISSASASRPQVNFRAANGITEVHEIMSDEPVSRPSPEEPLEIPVVKTQAKRRTFESAKGQLARVFGKWSPEKEESPAKQPEPAPVKTNGAHGFADTFQAPVSPTKQGQEAPNGPLSFNNHHQATIERNTHQRPKEEVLMEATVKTNDAPPPVPPKMSHDEMFIHRPPAVMPAGTRPRSPTQGSSLGSVPPSPTTANQDHPGLIDVGLVGKDRYDPQSKAFSYVSANALKDHFKSPKKQTRLVQRIEGADGELLDDGSTFRGTGGPGSYQGEEWEHPESLSSSFMDPNKTASSIDQRSDVESLSGYGERYPGDTTERKGSGKKRKTRYNMYRQLDDYSSDMDDLCDPEFYLSYSTGAQSVPLTQTKPVDTLASTSRDSTDGRGNARRNQDSRGGSSVGPGGVEATWSSRGEGGAAVPPIPAPPVPPSPEEYPLYNNLPLADSGPMVGSQMKSADSHRSHRPFPSPAPELGGGGPPREVGHYPTAGGRGGYGPSHHEQQQHYPAVSSPAPPSSSAAQHYAPLPGSPASLPEHQAQQQHHQRVPPRTAESHHHHREQRQEFQQQGPPAVPPPPASISAPSPATSTYGTASDSYYAAHYRSGGAPRKPEPPGSYHGSERPSVDSSVRDLEVLEEIFQSTSRDPGMIRREDDDYYYTKPRTTPRQPQRTQPPPSNYFGRGEEYASYGDIGPSSRSGDNRRSGAGSHWDEYRVPSLPNLPPSNSRSVTSTPVRHHSSSLHHRSLSHDQQSIGSDFDPDEWLDNQLAKLRLKRDDPTVRRRKEQEKILLEELKHINDDRSVRRGKAESEYSVEGYGSRPASEVDEEEIRGYRSFRPHFHSQSSPASPAVTHRNMNAPRNDSSAYNRQSSDLSLDRSRHPFVAGKPPTPPPRERSNSPRPPSPNRRVSPTPVRVAQPPPYDQAMSNRKPHRSSVPDSPHLTDRNRGGHEAGGSGKSNFSFDHLESLLWEGEPPLRASQPSHQSEPPMQQQVRSPLLPGRQSQRQLVAQSPKSILKKSKSQTRSETTTPISNGPYNGPPGMYGQPQYRGGERVESSSQRSSLQGTQYSEMEPSSPGGRSETPSFPVKRMETPQPYHPLLYDGNGDPRSPSQPRTPMHHHHQPPRPATAPIEYPNRPAQDFYRRSPSPGSQYYGQSRRSSVTSLEPMEVIHHHPVFVKDTSKYWYKPNISREDAINILKDKPPGTFIVRDSNSFPGAFGLALKVATPPPGVQTKSDGTELVRHFLIEPSAKGVKLKGCNNEPVFGTLSALVYQHSITPLALPSKLILPEFDPATTQEQINSAQILLEQGAACNVTYIHSCDMETLTGPEAVRRAVDQAFALYSHKELIPVSVHFKVSAQGITVTDNTRKLFFRRHYPVNTVTFCGLDPDDRRWTAPGSENEGPVVTQARIFGFVGKKIASRTDNACHIFAEFEPEQPATAIVNFVTKVMMVPLQRS